MRLATALVLALLLVASCGEEPSPDPAPSMPDTPATSTEPVVVQLDIEGMHCESCVRAVTGWLRAVDGVTEANVDLEAERATVTMRPGTDPATLVAAVRGGYKAKLSPTEDEK